jgi:hypothetical protein
LRRIIELERDEMVGGSRKLYEELHNMYPLTSCNENAKVKDIEMGRHVEHMWAQKSAYRILMENPEGKTPLRKPGRRWEDNIKANIRELGCGGWTGLIWLRIGTSGGLLGTR